MRLTRNKQAVEVNERVVEMFGLSPVSSSESIVTADKGAKEDVRSRIRTANVIVIQLYPVWKNRNISNKTNIRILNTNLKLALMAYMPGRLERWTPEGG